MTVARIQRGTIPDRIKTLEDRADAHDIMASQVSEMYALLTRWRNINWFVVKLGAGAGGALVFIAGALTIADKIAHFGGH